MNKDILYKFRDWNDKYHKRILTESELFFSSADSFNDPFDGRLSLDYSNYTEKDWYKGYKFQLQRDNPHTNNSKIEKMVQEWMGKKLYKNPHHFKRHKEFVYNRNKKKFGIISLSGTNSEILLWSHYAASHTGFCVGFNKEKLNDYRISALNKFDFLYDCFKVEYSKEYPTLDAKKLDDDQNYVLKPLIIKSDKWVYEKEFRLILINGTNKAMTLGKDIFENIVLGAKISQTHRTEIIEIAQNNFPKINIFQANICEDRYDIELSRIQ